MFAYEAAHTDTDSIQMTCSNFIATKCRENKEKGKQKYKFSKDMKPSMCKHVGKVEEQKRM